MPHSNIIKAKSEDEIWKKISDQLKNDLGKKDYSALIEDEQYSILLDIDIDPEGGSDDGELLTSLTAKLSDEQHVRFSITHQGFKSEVKKIFGMQDIEIGFQEFDNKFIIKGNETEKVKEIFSNEELRFALLKFDNIIFEIRDHKIGAHKEVVLALDISEVVNDPLQLRSLYKSFKLVLSHF